jgi:hypothetical protein
MNYYINKIVTRFNGMLQEPELSEIKRVRFIHRDYSAAFKKEALKIHLNFVRQTYNREMPDDDYCDNGNALTPREINILDTIAQLERALKMEEDAESQAGSGSFDFPPPVKKRKNQPGNDLGEFSL